MTTWATRDMSEALADLAANGGAVATPDILTLDNGAGLFYSGRTNMLFGESGHGKTWLALLACQQEIAANRHVFYIDYESGSKDILSRLVYVLGIRPDDIVQYFHYVYPEEPFANDKGALLQTVRDYETSLVILDSVGESLAIEGVNGNDDGEVARWMLIPRAFAQTGAAVVMIDHVTKNASSGYSIGSQRKRAGLTGASYAVESKAPFSQHQAGVARITCWKDRVGHYARSQTVATLEATPVGNETFFALRLPADQQQQQTNRGPLTSAVLDLLSTQGPLSGNNVQRILGCGRNQCLDAIRTLHEAGKIIRSGTSWQVRGQG